MVAMMAAPWKAASLQLTAPCPWPLKPKSNLWTAPAWAEECPPTPCAALQQLHIPSAVPSDGIHQCGHQPAGGFKRLLSTSTCWSKALSTWVTNSHIFLITDLFAFFFLLLLLFQICCFIELCCFIDFIKKKSTSPNKPKILISNFPYQQKG